MVLSGSLEQTVLQLEKKLKAAGQEHLLTFWDDLAPEQKNRLAGEISDVDFALIGRLAEGEGILDADSVDYDKTIMPLFQIVLVNKEQSISNRAAGVKTKCPGSIAFTLRPLFCQLTPPVVHLSELSVHYPEKRTICNG
jgi:hypothetical protein